MRQILSAAIWVLAVPSASAAQLKASAPPATPSEAQMASYRGVAKVAKDSCTVPTLNGWAAGGNLGGEVKLNPSLLAKVLASAGVKLKGDVSAQAWAGMLQKDAVGAFENHNDCVAKLFIAMVNSLPRVDDAGKLLSKPPRPEVIYKLVNSTTETNTANKTETNVGNINDRGGIQNNNAGTATNYNAPVSYGGQQTVNYNNPPITDTQKEQAREALFEEMKQLARYPEADPVNKGPSLVQQTFRFNAPRSLYVRLLKYYDDTITQLPHGDQLLAYKRQYYDFEQTTKQFDEIALPKIGAITNNKMPAAWQQHLIYCIERREYTSDDLKANWGGSNFIDFNTAESVCAAIKSDSQLGPTFGPYSQSIEYFTNAATQLLALYR